jgi:hypothetical protein
VSAGLLLTLLAAMTLARVTGHYQADPQQATRTSNPITASESWLSTRDYRLIGQLQGTRTTSNVTVHRHGNVLRGNVQTMVRREQRQAGYYRFRVRTGVVETSTSGPFGQSNWVTASPAQTALVHRITDPQQMLAPFQTSDGIRDMGPPGNATKYYRTPRGDSLYMINERPIQMVTHEPSGETWVARFLPR